jgi:putative SOS response-associated peptidase YedK
MCGRFTLTLNIEDLKEVFNLTEISEFWNPSYNIAPTHSILTIKAGEATAALNNWGINRVIDHKNSIIINIRKETLTEKSTFTSLFKTNRCIIPMDGFFEWKKEGNSSLPYYFKMADSHAAAFAGLWNFRRMGDRIIEECAIITCPANGLVGNVHSRMPVIFDKHAQAVWLSGLTFQNDLLNLLQGYAAEKMVGYLVAPQVNSVLNNSPDNLTPFVPRSRQMKLDL